METNMTKMAENIAKRTKEFNDESQARMEFWELQIKLDKLEKFIKETWKS